MMKTFMWLSLFVAFQAIGATGPGNLLEFLTAYSEVILHVSHAPEGDKTDDPQIDFWKRTGSTERDEEAIKYLRHRGLLEEFEGGRVFFLRILTEEELAEVLHFRMEVIDPGVRETLDTRFFRFALVRMVEVDAGGKVDRESLGLDAEDALSVPNLRERVADLVTHAPVSVETTPAAE